MGVLDNKLAKETLAALREAVADGDFNEEGTEAYSTWYGAFGDLIAALGTEHEERGLEAMSPPRRKCYALAAVGGALPWDGLMVGVCVNQPELVEPAAKAAREFGLDGVSKVLAEVAKMLPPSSLSDCEDRLRWYEGDGEKHQAKLEKLGEKLEKLQKKEDWVEACLRFAIDNPEEFFEK